MGGRGKGKGSGSGKSRGGAVDGRDGKSGKKGNFPERGEIKESEVQLGEHAQDVIVKLMAELMKARGEEVPSGQRKSKKPKKKGNSSRADAEEDAAADEEEDEEDFQALVAAARVPDEELADALDGDVDVALHEYQKGQGEEAEEVVRSSEDEQIHPTPLQRPSNAPASGHDEGLPEASRVNNVMHVSPEGAEGPTEVKSERESAKEEERVKRRLLRQLVAQDKREAGADKAKNEQDAQMVRKKVPAQGNSVRLFLWNETKQHEKPKGPILFPRGGEEAVQEVLKTAKAKLSLKGGKKEVWAYVHGGPTGHDAKNAKPVKLTDTLQLADSDIIIVSTKPVPADDVVAPAVAPKAADAEKPSPDAELNGNAQKGAADAHAEKPQATALDAVRAAYRRRADARPRAQARTQQDIAAESTQLLSDARAFDKSPEMAERRAARAALPASEVKTEFLAALASSQVVVVSGETGSGKTTQCPHFILEDYVRRGIGGECSIVCTQPRRIAAIGVAERVSHERAEEPGATVGFAVRLENKSSARTRLLFCTTGVLMQQLNEDPLLQHVTHVVVDEAHERNLQTDFLLTILRDLLPRRPDLKLVLMSATLEKGLFVDYFAAAGKPVPSVHIPGRTHPVQIRFLREAELAIKGRSSAHVPAAAPAVNAKEPDEGPSVDDDLQTWICHIHGVDAARVGGASRVLISPTANQAPDYRLLADLVAAILKGDQGPQGASVVDDGAILVFLPGHVEIERALGQLRSHPGVGEHRAWLLPLHGQMPTQRQRLVFRGPPSPGLRKVVLSTNIAETSITIDDVTHVIDCGQVKENRYDPRSRMSVLATCFVSKAAAKQRAGRAGRVRPGVCWRLFKQDFFDTHLPEHTLCEMRRTALEELVLQLRLLELGNDPGEFLRRAPEPPSREALEAAVRTLVQIGALGTVAEGMPLTPLGFHLAHMPMDVRTAKMLVYGALMRCLGPILTVAACLSHKSPFTRGFGGKGKESELREARDVAFGDLRSDHLAVVQAFDGWKSAQAQGRQAERQYCDQFGLSSSALESMSALRERFRRYLEDVGFIPSTWSSVPRGQNVSADAKAEQNKGEEAGTWDPNENSNDPALLRCVLCAGLYPNVAQIQRVSVAKGSSKTFLVSVGDLDRCALHPGSLNARRLNEMQAVHGWLLYHTKVKTSQVFLHDATLIGSIPLLLFGGGDLQLARDRRTIVVDRSLRFDGGRREETAVLLKLLRREVDRLLLLKIADPAADISAAARPLLGAVAKLLHLEGTRAGGVKKNYR